MKKGVLVMAYGSPDTLADVEAYYMDILKGRRPSAAALEELTERYAAVGDTPLLRITKAQADGLQEALGPDYQVFLGMRHWHPYIRQGVKEMQEAGIKEAVGLVMAPHYSRMSIGRYQEAVNAALEENPSQPISFSYIESWGAEPEYIQALAERVGESLPRFSADEQKDLHVIFTAHSLPQRILEWQDPYPEQLLESSRLVAEKAGIDNWHFSFQSAGRTPEPWLGPDLLDKMADLAAQGVKSVLVCSVGFITDHLEVLYDIDIEAQKRAKELGIHLERTPSLNAHPLLINLFERLVKERL